MHPPQILTLFTQAQTILAYFSFRQEPHLPVYRHQTPLGLVVLVNLLWHTWKPGEHLQMGAYDIFEPCPDALQIQLK